VALDVELTIATGSWFRQTPAGVNPASRPIPPDDNRWQRGRVVDAVYFAADHDCVWAEWYRHLAERGIPPQAALPRDLWTYDVESLELVDLRNAERLGRFKPLGNVSTRMASPESLRLAPLVLRAT